MGPPGTPQFAAYERCSPYVAEDDTLAQRSRVCYSLLWILKAIFSFVLWHGCCMGGWWQSLFFIDIFLNENFQNLSLILTDLKVHIDSAMITLYTLLVPFSFISRLHSFTQSPLLDASTKGVCPAAQGCLLLALRPYLLKLLVDLDLFLLMSYIFSF